MELPERKDLDLEGFKSRWQLSPDQLANSVHTEEELNTMQEFLLMIEEGFREYIVDWDLEDSFFLYDDDEDCILRMYSFSKGLTKCWCVISCYSQIEVASENIDVPLLADICNVIMSGLFDLVGKNSHT